jgi:hypothetical protein
MGCRRHHLQEAFFGPGPHAFRVWGYGTADLLADVLQPDHFAPRGGLLCPGELIYVSSRPTVEPGSPAAILHQPRMAIVMVTAASRGCPQVRMVQNFGTAEDDMPEPARATKAAPRTPAKPRAATRGAAAGSSVERKRAPPRRTA